MPGCSAASASSWVAAVGRRKSSRRRRFCSSSPAPRWWRGWRRSFRRFRPRPRASGLAGDTEVLQPLLRGLGGVAPGLRRAAATWTLVALVVDVLVGRERFELVHDDPAAAGGTAKMISAHEADRRLAGIGWTKGSELRRRADQ